MKKLEKKFWRQYKILCAVRILSVLIPQTGYIHPDEYFQSIEILAGDTFDLETHRPWEFNMTFPIRNIGIPYFTVGLSYKILNTVNMFVQYFLQTSVVSPYTIVVIPRLFICLLSFLCDYCMYHICRENNEKYKSRLLILNTSYVMVIYGTRTFSNTLEMIFFSLLLYYVAESMIFSNVIVKHHEYFKKRYDSSETVIDKAKFHKMIILLASHNYRNFFIISTINVLGFFNRPTFLCYSLIPTFFWLYRSIGTKSVTPLKFNFRSALILVSAIPTVVFLVIIDSFYYGYLTWGELGMLDISINSFVFPSLNFVRYNWNEKNLEMHGKHPVYLHCFINIPLLFNVLGIIALFGFGSILRNLLKRKYHLLPSIRSIKGLMTTSLIAPLFLLSSFAHQEPRFIIPLIFPMVYLYADKIYEEPEDAVVEIKDEKKEMPIKPKITHKSNLILKLWVTTNVILSLFYGFLHQGGVYSTCDYLHKEVRRHPNTQYNIFTSHIYNMPYSLFMQPSTDRLFISSKTKYQKTKRVFLYEEGSKETDVTMQKIISVLEVLESKNIRNKLLFILPSSLDKTLNMIHSNSTQITIRKMKTVYPHLSTEAIPDITDFVHKIAFVDMKSLNFQELLKLFCEIFKSFGLSVYVIGLEV